MSDNRILIVEDEKEIAELIQDYLEDEGYMVRIALDGETALKVFNEFKPHLIILDIMLPNINGVEVCKMIREKSNIPIIILSVKKSEGDKIKALGIGADDYVVKPFSPKELIARVNAQLRRYIQMVPTKKQDEKLIFGELEIDLKGHIVRLSGRKISLASKEFDILKLLAMNPYEIVTREEIFQEIWGYGEYGDIGTVTVHIRKIREKIERDPSNPIYIKTAWGVGYRFEGGK